MNEMVAPAPEAVEPRRDAQVMFTGINGVFRRLVTVGALLEVVTFGFYRFWLTTNMRRHLWTNTSIDGDPLEYTGRGRELLIGFLFALAVLVPINLLVFLVGIEAEKAKAFLSIPLFLFFYVFSQFAVFRARRYRLTRTIWRGVRFWMTGSGVVYAGKAVLWQFLNLLTLGLSYPWSVAALERYKMGHTNYGNLEGAFTGSGWEFFKRGWWLWALAWVPLISYIGVIVLSVSLLPSNAFSSKNFVKALQEIANTSDGTRVSAAFSLAGLSFIILPFVFAAFKAIEWKWWTESIHFGDVRFSSDLKRDAFFGTYWKLIGLSYVASFVGILFMVIMIGLGVALMAASGINFNSVGAELQKGHFPLGLVPVIVCYVLSYLGLIQIVGIVRRIYLVQRIWKIVVASITVLNLEGAAHVIEEGTPASAFGEGLADGLDVAGF